MRCSIFLLLAMATALLLHSCCNMADCEGDNYNVRFDLFSAANEDDLLFGPNKKYDPHQIKIYSINGTDTSFCPLETVQDVNGSFMSVDFFPMTTFFYMELNSADIDTFTVFYKTQNSKCCNNVTRVGKFRYNHVSEFIDNYGVHTIYK